MIFKVENSFTSIAEYSSADKTLIEATLTYIDAEKEKEKIALIIAIKNAVRYGHSKKAGFLRDKLEQIGDTKVCLLKDDKFPTGVLFMVLENLENAHKNPLFKGRFTKYAVNDIRVKPRGTEIYRLANRFPALRYYQSECVDRAIDANRGTFEVCVGGGKTLIASNIIKRLGVRVLFIVPSSALLEQTARVFSGYFGKSQVQEITTKDVKARKKLKPIRVATVQTLASLNKQGLLSHLVEDVEMLMIDEAHHSGASSYTSLLPKLNHVYYRFNFSGTYTRNDSKIMELWGVCGEKLYKYNAAQAIEDGFLTPVKFKVRSLGGSAANQFHKEYTNNYGSREFLDAIVEEVQGIAKDKSILILVDRKEAVGHQIRDWLKVSGIVSTYVTGDNSRDEIVEAMELFNEKKIRILIASTILGEGADIRSTDVLILGRGGKSDIAITQAIGRAVRLYPGKKLAQVIDFDFKYSNWMNKHTRMRTENYAEEFAGEVVWTKD